jgi:hypothetical protein
MGDNQNVEYSSEEEIEALEERATAETVLAGFGLENKQGIIRLKLISLSSLCLLILFPAIAKFKLLKKVVSDAKAFAQKNMQSGLAEEFLFELPVQSRIAAVSILLFRSICSACSVNCLLRLFMFIL